MKIPGFAASALLVVLVFYLLIVGEALLLPLVIAIALWYLINTLAAQFARITIGNFTFPSWLSLTASLLSFLILVWALINFLGGRVDEVLEVFPVYQANLTTRLESLPFVDLAAYQEQGFLQVVTSGIDLPAFAASVAASFAGVLANGGLILIYILFLFLEQGNFDQKITALFSRSGQEDDARKIIERVRNDIQKYISIKMFTSSLTGLLSYGFLLAVGVDFAGVWGLLIFLLNFIPTVGSIIATIFPAMIALAQSDGYSLFLLVLIGIGVLQIAIGNILEPRLMGSSFNLSPIVILLNLGLWGYIWGIPGMFLCVPFLIILTIILSHFPQTRSIAIILSSDGLLRSHIDETQSLFSFDPSVASLPSTETEESTD
ncbi:MAG: AI-2E family transporter [Gammaproteobacteria bacterium]|nr:AI-2E family transporter [Gammaproteobacteria bacterium]MBT3859175.1 AI-2E family transporter [Gammaproteobacteria bacterium]MBT3987175.1 AI-2E family transporter [Gammaproteobacteria bacterium]MBT4257402.1 AI-2E family transporter [Gammaproteobacteria bacterium]MBT4583124.1 AI-2E family transporter [Gammaproteobacteria bacterium]